MAIRTKTAFAILLLAGSGSAAHAQPFTILVGTPPAGAYDVYGRLVSRHLQEYLPGKPVVIVRNMPGASGLTAANYLYNSAPSDGSMIGTFSRGVPAQPIFDSNGVRYDPTKFVWLGSPAQDVSVTFSWHTAGFKTYEDLLQKPMTVGATAATGDTVTFALALNRLIGTKLKIVTGYPGANDYFLAIEQGELEGASATSWSNLTGPKSEWLANKKINILLQLGVSKRADIPAPLVTELARNDLDRQALELIFSRQLFAYPFAAPPKTSDAAAKALREAFRAAMADPQLLAEAKKMGVDIEPSYGDDIQAIVEKIYKAPAVVIERARFATQPER
jgi:tripartite-type tricarboxylate transporter receptor subunit TctC